MSSADFQLVGTTHPLYRRKTKTTSWVKGEYLESPLLKSLIGYWLHVPGPMGPFRAQISLFPLWNSDCSPEAWNGVLEMCFSCLSTDLGSGEQSKGTR